MLGSGVYGSVRLVKRDGFVRAVKTSRMPPFPKDLHSVIAALREEACNFEHPHIIKRYWSRWLNGSFQVCMEVAEPITRAPADRVLHDISQALYCLHSHGFIHRDVKPENIVRFGDVYKLVDFGLSRRGLTHSSMTGYTISRWFRPPEMLRVGEDDAEYDGRVDMWSLALTAYLLERGKPLFHGSASDILEQYEKFVPLGVFAHLLCDYEERFTSQQLLKQFGVAPIEGSYLGGKKRDKLTKFVEMAVGGYDYDVKELGYEGIYNEL